MYNQQYGTQDMSQMYGMQGQNMYNQMWNPMMYWQGMGMQGMQQGYDYQAQVQPDQAPEEGDQKEESSAGPIRATSKPENQGYGNWDYSQMQMNPMMMGYYGMQNMYGGYYGGAEGAEAMGSYGQADQASYDNYEVGKGEKASEEKKYIDKRYNDRKDRPRDDYDRRDRDRERDRDDKSSSKPRGYHPYSRPSKQSPCID